MKNTCKRILAFVLCVTMLAGTFAVIPVVAETYVGSDEWVEARKVGVKLEWDASESIRDGAAVGDSDLKAVVTASFANDSKPVTVVVATFGISARSEKGEFTPEYHVINLTPDDNYETITVNLGKQKRYDASGDDTIVSRNGLTYRRQVGVRIVSVSENAYVISGKQTVRGYISDTYDDSLILKTTKNSSITDYSKDVNSNYLKNTAYSFNGAFELVSTDTMYSTYKHLPSGSNGQVDISTNPMSLALTNANIKKLVDRFSLSSAVSWTGRLTMSSEAGGLHEGAFEYRIYADVNGSKKTIFQYNTGKQNWGNGVYYTYNFVTKDGGEGFSITHRDANGRKYSSAYTANGVSNIKVFGDNQTTASNISYDKNFGDIYILSFLVDDSAPTIKEFYIDQNYKDEYGTSYSHEYKSGDEIYLAMRMSEPVQVDESVTTFAIKASYGDTSRLTFHYVGGNYTDTLIFKATVPDNKVISTNNIQITDIEGKSGESLAGKNCNFVYDFFLNRYAHNNSANFSLSGVTTTISCKIDNRTPVISVDSTRALGPLNVHTAYVRVTNMTNKGTLHYMWSKDRSPLGNPQGWIQADMDTTTSTFSATIVNDQKAYNGDYYLHLKATSAAGTITIKSIDVGTKEINGVKQPDDKCFVFDNTPPTFADVQTIADPKGGAEDYLFEADYGKYQDHHRVVIEIKDKLVDSEGYGVISDVWYYVKDPDGHVIQHNVDLNGDGIVDADELTEKVHVYGDGSNKTMKPYEKGGTFMFEIESLTHANVGLPDASFGEYTVFFVAKDQAGNTSADGIFCIPMMYDNRPKYGVTYSTNIEKVDEDKSLGGYNIYYNKKDETVLQVTAHGEVFTKGKDDRYALYSASCDGVTFFKNGALLSDYTWDNKGLAGAPIISNEKIGEEDGQMQAVITFAENAAGRYDFIFQKVGGNQSEILSFYVTPAEDSPYNIPYNYGALYDEQRLLINKVWQFAAGQYYNKNNTSGQNYDGTGSTGGNAKPIFSCYEKAYEYARFTEIQDIEILYLGNDSDSKAIINYLNSGTSKQYGCADGETQAAAPEQTWVRYKSKAWTPKNGLSDGYWVYYFYRNGEAPYIDVTSYADLSSVSPLLEAALKNNAEEIANKTGSWIYLTDNMGAVDSLGRPTYPKGAVFFDDVVYTAEESNFGTDMTYSGDKGIYSSFIRYDLDGEDVRIPIVADHTFKVDKVSGIHYRKFGTTDWKAISNGTSLRSLQDSGVYEFKEIGKGYRHYFVYCDFDAPLIEYLFVRQESGGSGESSGGGEERHFFSQFSDKSTFQAKKLRLKRFVDPNNAIAGSAVELDEFCYAYVETLGVMGANAEVVKFITLDALNSESGGAGSAAESIGDIPGGVYTLRVFDRLGNSYAITVRTNESKIFQVDPVLVENTSVSFYINREKSEIASFSVIRKGASGIMEEDTVFAKTKTYVKSGEYTITVKDIYGNVASQQKSLTRTVPAVSFYYRNDSGRLVEMKPLGAEEETPLASASVKKHSDVLYTISSSVNVGISYNAYAKYEYEIFPQTTKHTVGNNGSNKTIEIPAGETKWTLRVYYANDEETEVSITSITDTVAPTVTAEATIPDYRYHEDFGYNNVLFHSSGQTEKVQVPSGGQADASQVVFRWQDDEGGTGVRRVSLQVDDAEPQLLDIKTDNFVAKAPGKYRLSVSDLLGNTTVHEFTLASGIDFGFVLDDGTALPCDPDPQSQILGSGNSAVFQKTSYAGQAFKLVLGSDARVTFAYGLGNTVNIYELTLNNGKLSFGTHAEMLRGSITPIELASKKTGEIVNGSVFIQYTSNSQGLTLTFPFADTTLERWQFRVSDLKESSPAIFQLERSNKRPDLVLLRADSKDKIMADDKTYTGINEGFTFSGRTEDITSVIAYRSEKHTMDYANVANKNVINMLSSGLIGTVREEGYYKVVLENKYGNTIEYLLRINFGAQIDVLIRYVDFPERELNIEKDGVYSYYSNRSVLVRIWNTATKISVKQNNKAYNPETKIESGCISMTFKEKGQYELQATDDCDNVFVLHMEITAPDPLVYARSYLSGFNIDALMYAEQYTNAPVSVSKQGIDSANIEYVATRKVGASKWDVIYDTLSQEPVPYSEQGFQRCIGKENGAYEVLFTDRYGNQCVTVVNVSNVVQLSIKRTAKNNAGNAEYTVEEILSEGVWSNYLVTLKNKAKGYKLTVDGKEVKFDEKGEYSCELPLRLGDTAHAEHKVTYVDSNGNKCSFVIHLMRKTPEVSLTHDSEELVYNNILHVKGDFCFSWLDKSMKVVYTVDGGSKMAYTQGDDIKVDGAYLFTFTDKAGNMESRRINRDTAVKYTLSYGNKSMGNGVSVTGRIRIDEEGEKLTLLEVKKDGKKYDGTGRTFSEHGSYEMIVSDPVGNTAKVFFALYNNPVQAFTYTASGEYAIYQVWQEAEGRLQPYGGITLNEDGYAEFNFYEDGVYQLDLIHVPTGTYSSFPLTVDNIPPSVAVIGEIKNGITREDITFDGLLRGDTVEVWREGKLLETYKIGSGRNAPEITQAGLYKVVVKDAAGNETVCEFEREYTTNTAANVLVCLLLLGTAIGGAIIIRNRGKVRNK